ncbi:hypothetical protein NMY22_g16050 [Coprinellus aureogranulatus]|nr:hypothetical protein NMY22_g16050 [Coprinellus aureogranulatus]
MLSESFVVAIRPPALHLQPLPPVTEAAELPEKPRLFLPKNPSAPPADLFSVQYTTKLPRRWRFIRQGDENKAEALIFFDGSCLGNGKQGGRPPSAGVGVVYGPKRVADPIMRSLPGRDQTSNRAELYAAITALECRDWKEEGFVSIVLASDSEYVVNGITNHIERWRLNGWRTAGGQR